MKCSFKHNCIILSAMRFSSSFSFLSDTYKLRKPCERFILQSCETTRCLLSGFLFPKLSLSHNPIVLLIMGEIKVLYLPLNKIQIPFHIGLLKKESPIFVKLFGRGLCTVDLVWDDYIFHFERPVCRTSFTHEPFIKLIQHLQIYGFNVSYEKNMSYRRIGSGKEEYSFYFRPREKCVIHILIRLQ